MDDVSSTQPCHLNVTRISDREIFKLTKVCKFRGEMSKSQNLRQDRTLFTFMRFFWNTKYHSTTTLERRQTRRFGGVVVW